jgi:molybdopterin/thiamine biosynthesis adenylyltransferase
MSQQLISLNLDLKHLRDDGYGVEIRSGYLIINDVPYVSSTKEIKLGVLVSELTMSGDLTAKPNTHVALFSGEQPCDCNGVVIQKIMHQTKDTRIDEGLTANRSFSSKPKSGGYRDFYEKMTTYIAILTSQAQAINPEVKAQTFPVIKNDDEESVFAYLDTASSRADIATVTKKLELDRVAILGLGGTGSYVLDFVAKTPVKNIALFDGDTLYSHNAFRSPGAVPIESLREKPKKASYFKRLYSKMHCGIDAYDYYIDAGNVEQLRFMKFVFICMDNGETKKMIVERLEEYGVSFVDVGMGVNMVKESLHGILRVTTSTPQMRDHVYDKNRIPFTDGGENNDYKSNIQIADLNALNAALAVVKWKKLCGFYADLENEHFSAYTIDGNSLINEDMP